MPSRRRQATAAASKAALTLTAFMRDKARAGCVICKLAPEIQAQLGRSATKKGYTREDQVEWLTKLPGGATVTLEVLASHLNGKHYTGGGSDASS